MVAYKALLSLVLNLKDKNIRNNYNYKTMLMNTRNL